MNERFADAQAENLNVEVDYPLLEKLARPCRLKSQRMAGIRLDNDRIIRLLEVLMHSASHLGGLSAADIHQTVLDAHHLTPEQYTRNQLAYDLRKLKAPSPVQEDHAIVQRLDRLAQSCLRAHSPPDFSHRHPQGENARMRPYIRIPIPNVCQILPTP